MFSKALATGVTITPRKLASRTAMSGSYPSHSVVAVRHENKQAAAQWQFMDLGAIEWLQDTMQAKKRSTCSNTGIRTKPRSISGS
jgi:hypothetical protein